MRSLRLAAAVLLLGAGLVACGVDTPACAATTPTPFDALRMPSGTASAGTTAETVQAAAQVGSAVRQSPPGSATACDRQRLHIHRRGEP